MDEVTSERAVVEGSVDALQWADLCHGAESALVYYGATVLSGEVGVLVVRDTVEARRALGYHPGEHPDVTQEEAGRDE